MDCAHASLSQQDLQLDSGDGFPTYRTQDQTGRSILVAVRLENLGPDCFFQAFPELMCGMSHQVWRSEARMGNVAIMA